MDTGVFKKAFTSIPKCIIGHGRWATQGIVNKQNAHPFDIGDLIGAHNGTLVNKYKLFEGNQFGTDSEALYNTIDKKGLQEAIDTAIGAYALTWLDKNALTINLLRNKERPLFYVFTKDKKTLFWASEAWMLYGILGREQVETDFIHELPTNKLYSFKLPAAQESPFEDPKITEAIPKVPEVNQQDFFQGGRKKETFSKKTSITIEKKNTLPIGTAQIYSLKEVWDVPLIFEALYWERNAQGSIVVTLESYRFPNFKFKVHCKSNIQANDLTKAKILEGIVKSIASDPPIKKGDNPVYYYKVDYDSLKPFKNKQETLKTDHKGYYVSKKTFESKYKNGCVWCGEVCKYEDDILIIDATDYTCPSCRQDPTITQYLPANKIAH